MSQGNVLYSVCRILYEPFKACLPSAHTHCVEKQVFGPDWTTRHAIDIFKHAQYNVAYRSQSTVNEANQPLKIDNS